MCFLVFQFFFSVFCFAKSGTHLRSVQKTHFLFAVPCLMFENLFPMLSSPTHFYAFVFLRLRVVAVAVDLLVMYLGMFPRFAFQELMASCIQNRWLQQLMEFKTKFFRRIQALNTSDMTVFRKACSQNRSDNAFTCVTPLLLIKKHTLSDNHQTASRNTKASISLQQCTCADFFSVRRIRRRSCPILLQELKLLPCCLAFLCLSFTAMRRRPFFSSVVWTNPSGNTRRAFFLCLEFWWE